MYILLWYLIGLVLSGIAYYWIIRHYVNKWTYGDVAFVLFMALFGPFDIIVYFLFVFTRVYAFIVDNKIWSKPLFKDK